MKRQVACTVLKADAKKWKYVVTSALSLCLRRSITSHAYIARFSCLRCSIYYGCWPLVPNFPVDLATHLQWHMDDVQARKLERCLLNNPVWPSSGYKDATFLIKCGSVQNWPCTRNKKKQTHSVLYIRLVHEQSLFVTSATAWWGYILTRGCAFVCLFISRVTS